jgi:hypothetical protein
MSAIRRYSRRSRRRFWLLRGKCRSVSPARTVTSSIDSLLSIQRAGGLECTRSAESDSATSGPIRANGANVLGSVLTVRSGHYRI